MSWREFEKRKKANQNAILTWKTEWSTQLAWMWYATLNSNPGGKSCRLKGTFHLILADDGVASNCVSSSIRLGITARIYLLIFIWSTLLGKPRTHTRHIMKTTTYSFSTNCFFFLLYQLNLKPYWTPQTCSVSFIKKAKPPHQPTLSCFVYTKCRLVEEGKSIFAFLVYRSLNLSRNEEEEEYCVKKKKKCFSPCEPSVSKLTDGIIVYQSEVLGLVAGQFVGHGHGKIKWFRRVLVARRWILVPFARALLIGSVDRLEQKAARRIQGTWALCCHPPIVTCVNCLFVFYHFFFKKNFMHKRNQRFRKKT